MLIQLNATFRTNGLSGVEKTIIAPRVNSTAFNALAIRNVGLCVIGGVVGSSDTCVVSLVNPRGYKGNDLVNNPNGVIYWKQYGAGFVDEAKWLDQNRWRCLESVPLYLEWTESVSARDVRLEILFEEVKLKDFELIDMTKNAGWSI